MRIKIKSWKKLCSTGKLHKFKNGTIEYEGIVLIYGKDLCSVFLKEMSYLCGNTYEVDRHKMLIDGYEIDYWMFEVLEETTTISLNCTEDYYICDECGTTEILEYHNYCPMCGLKIIEADEPKYD